MCTQWSLVFAVSQVLWIKHLFLAFYRTMKDRRRCIMVRKHREHFPRCKAFCAYFSNWLISFHIYSAQTSCCLRAHSHFIYSSLFFLCARLWLYFVSNWSSLSPAPPALSFLFLTYFLLFSTKFVIPSFLLLRVCVCLCVIITRPPRGNQQWSLDSPDPLVPQHTCPWGAFPMSSEPLCACGCTICPCAWWRWSGHAGLPTGDLHTHPHSPEEALRMGHKKMTNKHKRWTPRDK